MLWSAVAVRMALLAGVFGTLGMIGVKVLGYRALLGLSGAKVLLAEAVLLLLVYGAAMIWPAPRRGVEWRSGSATALGAVAGFLQAAHVVVERFADLPQPSASRVVLGSMAGTFLLWGYAGYRARVEGQSLKGSWGAAVWSAMVTMTIAVTVGTALELFLAPYPLEVMRSWGEFQRSGWTDLQAFSIANTLDSASSHLLIGPVIATVIGLVGSGVASLRRRGSLENAA